MSTYICYVYSPSSPRVSVSCGQAVLVREGRGCGVVVRVRVVSQQTSSCADSLDAFT